MQNLFELHKQVNPTEVYVGWYSTGLKINQQSVMIHNYFAREMDTSPIHLCVGTDLSDGNMDIRAFESSPLGAVDGSSMERSIGFHFKPLPVAVDTFQSGALGCTW
jgi:translation initiation factor 3 subunit F